MIRMPSVGRLPCSSWAVAAGGAVVAGLAGHGADPPDDARRVSHNGDMAAIATLAGPAASSGGASAPDPAAPGADTVSYKEDVLPIFQKRCAKCHGGKGEDGEVVAEVSLILIEYERLMLGSEFGPVVTAGDPDDSWLVEMITEGDMPPEDEGDRVPEEEIAVIRTWIAEGAKNN